MPHLSPISWLIAPIIFFSLLMIISSVLWWSQLPTFPQIYSSKSSHMSNPWNWS